MQGMEITDAEMASGNTLMDMLNSHSLTAARPVPAKKASLRKKGAKVHVSNCFFSLLR